MIGYSNVPRQKIVNAIEAGEMSIRFYVTKKYPKSELNAKDLIPDEIDGIKTDVVEIGDVKILQVDKTARFRPVELGVSVGNWNITAGSLGMLYTTPDGKMVAGSNAHVISPDPMLDPSEITEKRILQPGAYHGGQVEDNVVGKYLWHKKIISDSGNGNGNGSWCPIANLFIKIVNLFLCLFERRGRVQYVAQSNNVIDFAVYTPTQEHINKVADDSLTDEPFIGHLFAGSDEVGVICKVSHIIEEGYTPLVTPASVKAGDIVKGCSFWCNYQTTVTDDSATIIVDYDGPQATFDDTIIVENDGTIKGGWSGSGWRKL